MLTDPYIPFTPEEYDAKYEVASRLTRFSEMKEFLDTLFAPYEGSGFAEFRAFKEGSGARQKFIALEYLADYHKEIFRWAHDLNEQGYGIYAGVLPRKANRGRKEDVMSAAWMWADLDFKLGGEQAVLTLIAELPAEQYPHMIVLSGNGLHAYWKLSKVIDFTSPEIIKRFETALHGFQNNVQPGTDSVQDISRVLRLPGTFNTKMDERKHVALVSEKVCLPLRKG